MNTKLLKQKILDLAIRGKLVPQDPNDEPASELLKRIRAEKEKLIAEGKIKRSKKTGDKPHYENENVPFEVPNSWEWCKIANLGEIVTGTTPSKLVGEYYNGEYPFYKPTDLEQGINTLTSSDSLTLAGLEASRCLPKESILVTCIGATIGKTGVIQREGSCNQQINAIIPYSHSNPLYIYYCIISGFMQNAIKSNASATTLPILNKTDFSNLLFPLPPFDEQKRIVAEVEKWFVLIDEIEAHKSDLQEYIKQAKSKVLDIAIHGKLVPQDPNDELAVELLKQINPNAPICDTSHYGNLPKGWCVVRLGDIYNHTTGKALKKSNTYGVLRKYITTSNLYWNSFDLTEVRSMYFTDEEIEKCTVHKGDLLLCNGGDVGRAAIWNYDEDICIQNHISRLRPKYENTIDNLFYYYILMYLKQKGLLNGKGVAITSLSAADLLSIQVPLPPKKEQVRIVQKIQEIEKRIQEICEEL